MRIGVDAACWANYRGYGRFTREVLVHLAQLAPADEFVWFVDPWLAEEIAVRADNVRIVSVRQSRRPTEAASAAGSRSVRDMLAFSAAVRRAELDVFFSPSVYTYFPLPPGLPAVVTIHDAIAERFPELTLPTRRARLFWRAKVRLAIWQARLVVTVSDYSARELSSVLGLPRTRIRVATEAPAAVYRPSDSAGAIRAMADRVGIPAGDRWVVYVGGFNPHKRIDVLVRAHAALSRELGPAAPHLILVGGGERDTFHQDVAAIRAAVAAAGTARTVHWAGYVPDEELRHLHSGALALVLPSESEGFGLPAVEAAACGAPVIATTESPLPELLAGGGIFIRPGDESALHAALHRVATDEPVRQLMAARARQRASELTWPRGARAILAAIREAASGSGRASLIHHGRPLQNAEIAG